VPANIAPQIRRNRSTVLDVQCAAAVLAHCHSASTKRFFRELLLT
jgi:hypothetical protein